jgi:hypothetical protein
MEQDWIWEYFQSCGLDVFRDAEPRYEACVRAALRRHPGIGASLNVGIGLYAIHTARGGTPG